MWTTYYMNKFSLVTDIGYREGWIKQLGDGTSGLIIIHTRRGFGVITNFCCTYVYFTTEYAYSQHPDHLGI